MCELQGGWKVRAVKRGAALSACPGHGRRGDWAVAVVHLQRAAATLPDLGQLPSQQKGQALRLSQK